MSVFSKQTLQRLEQARQRVLSFLALLAPLTVAGIAFGQSLDHDSSLPIEISADSLEVAQKEQVATFAGNVDAVQGDLVLSADMLKVHYEGKGGENKDGEGGGIGLAAGSSNSIQRIDAEGNVIITSPEETAEGSVGTYDVPAKLVTLEGQVVLTRGENVIRGERLELDLVSGKSRIIGAETTVADGEEGVRGERVRALFTPKTKQDDTAATPVPEARPK